MRKRDRSGWSLGTIVMLTITGLVIAGCVLLYPKLTGNIDVRVDASKIVVAFDDSLHSWSGQPTAVRTAENTPLPPNAPAAIVSASTEQTVAPTDTPAPITRSFTLTATGCVNVDTAIQKACTTDSGYRYDVLFEQLAPSVQSDLNLLTLENTVISSDKLTDINAPADLLAALRSGGFNTVCLGFPGALNGGVNGLNDTIRAIGTAGMTSYGVYPSREAREHLTLLSVNGVSVALLSYQSDLTTAGKKNTNKDEQSFVVAPPTLPTIVTDITTAKAAGAQVVIVSLCWGKEGATSPSASQRELAQGIADAGADIILGTHSNALQTIELLNSKRGDGTHQVLCAYSLGTLLSSNRDKRTAIATLLLHVNLTYRQDTDTVTFDSLTFTPTYAWRGKEDGRTSYRVLRANVEPPAFVESEQRKVLEKCLDLVRDVMKGTPVTEAQ